MSSEHRLAQAVEGGGRASHAPTTSSSVTWGWPRPMATWSARAGGRRGRQREVSFAAWPAARALVDHAGAGEAGEGRERLSGGAREGRDPAGGGELRLGRPRHVVFEVDGRLEEPPNSASASSSSWYIQRSPTSTTFTSSRMGSGSSARVVAIESIRSSVSTRASPARSACFRPPRRPGATSAGRRRSRGSRRWPGCSAPAFTRREVGDERAHPRDVLDAGRRGCRRWEVFVHDGAPVRPARSTRTLTE